MGGCRCKCRRLRAQRPCVWFIWCWEAGLLGDERLRVSSKTAASLPSRGAALQPSLVRRSGRKYAGRVIPQLIGISCSDNYSRCPAACRLELRAQRVCTRDIRPRRGATQAGRRAGLLRLGALSQDLDGRSAALPPRTWRRTSSSWARVRGQAALPDAGNRGLVARAPDFPIGLVLRRNRRAARLRRHPVQPADERLERGAGGAAGAVRRGHRRR